MELTREQKQAIAKAEARKRSQRGQRGGQQPGVSRQDAMGYLNQAGRHGMEGLASTIPGFRQAGEFYERQTGRDVFPEGGPETAADSAFKMLGVTAPLSLGSGAALAWRGAQPAVGPVVKGVQSFVDDMARGTQQFYARSPAAAIGSELGGGLFAGYGQHYGNETGLVGGEAVGTTAGGALGSFLGAVGPTAAQRGRDMGQRFWRDLRPGSEAAGKARVSRRLQDLYPEPKAAAKALDATPPESRLPAAQAIGNEKGMALQRTVESTYPGLQQQVERSKQQALREMNDTLTSFSGAPLRPGEWQRRIFQSIAPEGAEIRSAYPDQMLDEAYGAFRPLYNVVDGNMIPVTGFGDGLKRTVVNPDIYGVDEAAPKALAWLRSRTNQFNKAHVQDGAIDAKHLRSLRTEIRDTLRGLGPTERADRKVLEAADDYITRHMYDNLPEDVAATLAKTDKQYQKYKLVETAQALSDRGLTPDALHQSIRQNTSAGPYARGAEDSMRSLARFGEDVATVMGRPGDARLMVRGLSEPDRNTFRSTFINHMMREASRQDDKTGTMVLHGPTLKRVLGDQSETLGAMGFSPDDLSRLNTIADTVMRVQQKSPEQLASLFTDGPASLLELAAAISGAKWGQAAAGAGPGPTGIGSSLVLAQYGSRFTRRALSTLFDDVSYKVLMEASKPTREGRQLYKALLTSINAPAPQQEKAAGVILGYMYPSAAEGAEALLDMRDPAHPMRDPEQRRELLPLLIGDPWRSIGAPESVRQMHPSRLLQGLLGEREQQGAPATGLLEQ